MEYTIIVIVSLLLITNDYLDFLSKSFAVAALGILIMALLHITIKDAVKEAIIESRDR